MFIPVALLGFLALPSQPDNYKSRVLTVREIELAQARMAKEHREPRKPLTWSLVKTVLSGGTTTIPGAIIAVNLAEAEIPSLLEKLRLTTENNTVHAAYVNSPTNITRSGLPAPLRQSKNT